MPSPSLQPVGKTFVDRRLSLVRGRHDFASNDYLGLSQNPVIRERLVNELKTGCALGATGSRLLTGHTSIHVAVEVFLASTFRAQSALLFSSGYMASLGVICALDGESTEFFSDELNHASLIDGIRLTKSTRSIYRHNDLFDLKLKLKASSEKTKVIVTESVFSQDGDIALIDELLELAQEFGAWLVIDEAHATGIFGKKGLGLTEPSHHYEKLVTLHGCGKALGAQGAFVISNESFRHLMINRARSFIFTTAISPLAAKQIQFAIEMVITDTSSRLDLQHNIKLFKRAIGFGETHIIPVILGSNEAALKAQQALQDAGFDIRAIRSPTVRPGTERLRVTIKSFHSTALLEDLALRLTHLKAET